LPPMSTIQVWNRTRVPSGGSDSLTLGARRKYSVKRSKFYYRNNCSKICFV
jgi:hypothetical protein